MWVSKTKACFWKTTFLFSREKQFVMLFFKRSFTFYIRENDLVIIFWMLLIKFYLRWYKIKFNQTRILSPWSVSKKILESANIDLSLSGSKKLFNFQTWWMVISDQFIFRTKRLELFPPPRSVVQVERRGAALQSYKWHNAYLCFTHLVSDPHILDFMQKNWFFATYSDFLIFISFPPNVVELVYFKLWILLDKIILVWNIKGLHH